MLRARRYLVGLCAAISTACILAVVAAPTGALAASPPALAALEVRAAQLEQQRDDLTARVLQLELAKQTAEDGYEVAVTRYSEHLVELYKQGDASRMELLMAARDASDVVVRAEIAAQLVSNDRKLVSQFDEAVADIEASAQRVRRTQRQLGDVQEQLQAVRGRLDNYVAAAGPVDPEKFSIDSSLVFETTPTYLAGYGGAPAGGALAAIGSGDAGAGSTCEPPQDGLSASTSTEFGEASWYGPGFDGHETSSGETYDQFALTAAHRTLPMGSIVRVTAANGRCVFVRINDRGPFVDGRIIDLSWAAAQRLGIDGTMDVQLQVWNP